MLRQALLVFGIAWSALVVGTLWSYNFGFIIIERPAESWKFDGPHTVPLALAVMWIIANLARKDSMDEALRPTARKWIRLQVLSTICLLLISPLFAAIFHFHDLAIIPNVLGPIAYVALLVSAIWRLVLLVKARRTYPSLMTLIYLDLATILSGPLDLIYHFFFAYFFVGLTMLWERPSKIKIVKPNERTPVN